MIKIENIRGILEPLGWELLSDSYTNLTTLMKFKCPEGHEIDTTWKKLRDKISCPICNQNPLKKAGLVQNIPIKKHGAVRTLGLDQATYTSGYSIYDDGELVAYGTFEANSKFKEAERIHEIKNWLIALIATAQPNVVGIEGIQYQQKIGVTTFQTLARLQGVLIEVCVDLGVNFIVVPTNTWRHHCSVKGSVRYDKKMFIKQIVKEKYDITVSEDAADAIGIGKYTADNFKPVFVPKTEFEDWT